MDVIKTIDARQMKEDVPAFSIGDTVDVHVKIVEGEKERIQVFQGTVIAQSGSGMSETFTVRRIVQGEGVERVFPIHSPWVVDVKVKKRGHVRRAKLYYLRDRVGKATRVKEAVGAGAKAKKETPAVETPAEEPAEASADAEGESNDE